MVSTIPDNQDTEVPVDTTITVIYDRKINPSRYIKEISLKTSTGEGVDISTSISGIKLNIKPKSNLVHGTKYWVTIPEDAVKGYIDCIPTEIETFSFTTASICLDLNDDGKVDILDLLWMASKIGQADNSDAMRADVNCDGQVNVLDLMLLSQNIGARPE